MFREFEHNTNVFAFIFSALIHCFTALNASSIQCSNIERLLQATDLEVAYKLGPSRAHPSNLILNLCTYDYHCCGSMTGVLNNHLSVRYQKDPNNFEEFQESIFLQLIKHKHLAFLGDSLAVQQYNDLDARLRHHLSPDQGHSYDGNGTHLCPRYPCNFIPPKHFASIRRYDQYNATISFCRDPFLNFSAPTVQAIEMMNFCLRRALESDILVITIGIWWATHQKPAIWGTDKDEFLRTFPQALNWISSSSQALLILRTIAPCGTESRPPTLGQYVNHACPPVGPEAKWLKIYNQMIRSETARHGGLILDSYTVATAFSRVAREYRQRKPYLRIFNDTIHFCAGGVPHGWNLLLQQLLWTVAKRQPVSGGIGFSGC